MTEQNQNNNSQVNQNNGSQIKAYMWGLLTGIILTPFLTTFIISLYSLGPAVESITDKNKVAMRIMLAESSKKFDTNVDAMGRDTRDEFCEKRGFDRVYDYTSESITCGFYKN